MITLYSSKNIKITSELKPHEENTFIVRFNGLGIETELSGTKQEVKERALKIAVKRVKLLQTELFEINDI